MKADKSLERSSLFSFSTRRWTVRSWIGILGTATLMLALFAFPPALNSFASETTVQESPRRISEIRGDVRALAAKSRKADNHEELSRAVVGMCRLHHEIVTDDRFQKSRELQGLRAQLWQRLKTIKKDLNQQIARAERQRQRELKAGGRIDGQILDPSANSDQPSADEFDFLADQISQQMAFANQMTGGPSQVFAYASGQWAGLPDNGPELVRLIEDTINPDHWEKNGGPGRIRYYKPLMIIVVTGSTQVHDDLTHMLKTLRRISR